MHLIIICDIILNIKIVQLKCHLQRLFTQSCSELTQRAHICTENVLKTRFQDVQNVNSDDVHKT